MEKKRFQKGRMRKLAKQVLGNRDRDGHLLWDPRVGVDPTVASPPQGVPQKERVPDLFAPKSREEEEWGR